MSQNSLVQELRAECQTQADTIQQLSSKYKGDNKQLKRDNAALSRQLDKTRERLGLMEGHEIDHEKVHGKLRQKLSELDEENRLLTRQASVTHNERVSLQWYRDELIYD